MQTIPARDSGKRLGYPIRLVAGANDMEHGLIAWLIIGAVAGFLAGKVMRGAGFGLLADIALGIVGAFVGGHVFRLVGLAPGHGMIGSIITAFIGAVAVLLVVRLFSRAT
jgi:uncharacterized membrane protein YeaQ/YmgE (transglycosylase-associated protein family)